MQSVVVYSLNHDTTAYLGSPLPQFFKIGPHLHMYNRVRVHPCAHPQHMKVLNRFLYIQYGCGMQSGMVYSLNHDTWASPYPKTSYRLHLTPIFQNLAPTCTGTTVQGCTHMIVHSI